MFLRKQDRKASARKGPEVEIVHGTVRIDCRKCSMVPNAGSPVCVRCMMDVLYEHGGTERIQLRSGKDTEISGRAAELLCDMALLGRDIRPVPSGKMCDGCKRECNRLLRAAWREFPEPAFSAARSELVPVSSDRPECTECMRRTSAALDAAEQNMEEMRRETADAAAAVRGGR